MWKLIFVCGLSYTMVVNPLWVYVTMGVTTVKGFRICSNQIKIKQVMSPVFLAKPGWVPSNNAPRLGSESQLCTAGVITSHRVGQCCLKHHGSTWSSLCLLLYTVLCSYRSNNYRKQWSLIFPYYHSPACKNYTVLVLVLCQNIGLKRIVIGITDLGFGFIKKIC